VSTRTRFRSAVSPSIHAQDVQLPGRGGTGPPVRFAPPESEGRSDCVAGERVQRGTDHDGTVMVLPTSVTGGRYACMGANQPIPRRCAGGSSSGEPEALEAAVRVQREMAARVVADAPGGPGITARPRTHPPARREVRARRRLRRLPQRRLRPTLMRHHRGAIFCSRSRSRSRSRIHTSRGRGKEPPTGIPGSSRSRV
jgi:hypothetical protein